MGSDNASSGSKEPQASLEELRSGIDRVDGEILALLTRRAELAREVGTLKRQRGERAYAPHREEMLLDRLREMGRDAGLSPEAVTRIFREIISACRALEAPLRVAFLGPEATFTHIATHRHFGSDVHFSPQPTQADVFQQVERERADYGVVPIENSTMGVVGDTLDLFARSGLQICGEILLPVAHHLLGNATLAAVERTYSHRQAFAQCALWLRRHLPNCEQIEVGSTAEAARRAAKEPGAAAIASDLAAELYGLNILAQHIEDSSENITRFLVIGRHIAGRTGRDKTSLLFAVKHEVGALVRVLERFGSHDINLAKIESRPSRIRSWEYLFYVDVEGHTDDESLRAALAEIEAVCQFVKVLGSYPRA
jgi:chorismate mutase/prephenate dehydratase